MLAPNIMTDWLMLGAVLAGPILAVQVERWLHRRREDRERRLTVFRGLMATRARRMSQEHVQALNMIDCEFDARRPADKPVVRAWQEYSSHLNTRSANIDLWVSSGDELFIKLLNAMGSALGYDFDRAHLKHNSYSPQGHAVAEEEQAMVRRGLIGFLRGKISLPVHLSNEQPSPEKQLAAFDSIVRRKPDEDQS